MTGSTNKLQQTAWYTTAPGEEPKLSARCYIYNYNLLPEHERENMAFWLEALAENVRRGDIAMQHVSRFYTPKEG